MTSASHGRVAALVLLLPVAGLLPCNAAGQRSVTPSASEVGHPYRSQSVSPHSHGTAVAVSLRLPAGSQDDQEGYEGTAWLLGRVLEEQGNRALDPAEGVFTVTVHRTSTVLTLLALPSTWQSSWARLDSVIFDAGLDAALFERHSAEHLGHMTFEVGSPFRDFETEAASLLGEPGSAFTRPMRGTLESLALVSAQSLDLYRRSFFLRETAVQAVVGPSGLEASAGRPPPTAPEARLSDVAWVTGDRISLIRDVTNTWLAFAYPVPSDLPRTHLELVAHLLDEELDPTPPPPDRYALDVRIEETPRGPVLVVEASVFPESAARWEARILEVVETLAGEPMGEDFFRWRRRRFRTTRLLAESAPEVEAARGTADLLREGAVRDLDVEIWALDAAALQAAARSLGPPRRFLLGPDLGQDGTAGR